MRAAIAQQGVGLLSDLGRSIGEVARKVSRPHPLREAKVTVEDIEDNPGFFRIKLFIIPHFQVEGMDIGLSLVSQMPKAKS